MSVDRLWHWRCNFCGAEEQREAYGLPAGWKWYGGRGGTVHACGPCRPAADVADATGDLTTAAAVRPLEGP